MRKIEAIVVMVLVAALRAGAEDAPVWKESFDGLQPGLLLEQGRRCWFVDERSREDKDGFEITMAPDGKTALAIKQKLSSSRLRLKLEPYTATEKKNNCVTVTFQAGGGDVAPLLVTFFADKGTTQVASVMFKANGKIVLHRGMMRRQPEDLPFEWIPGEWNRVEVAAFPKKRKVLIRVVGADEKLRGEVSAPLVRGDADTAMPWYTLHFSQTAVSEAPWLVHAVTVENRKEN